MSSSGNPEREQIARAITKHLIEPEFAELLSAVAPDGSRPVIPALLGDKLGDVTAEVDAAGGAGNVVVPFANSIVILVMTKAPARARKTPPAVLKGDCTVGVFIQRLAQDAPDGEAVTYEIAKNVLTRAGIHVTTSV